MREPGEQQASDAAGDGGAEGAGAQGAADAGTGRLIAGRYRVTGQLGRGGMGLVRRARDEVLSREVAVKELRTYTDARGGELADLQRRMQREAQAAARVRHPGVIAVHDVARHEGRPVIVMELVDGPSLDDVLRQRGPIGPQEAASIGARVLDALAAAHRAGVLHRDVKPGNILLERGSTPGAGTGAGPGGGRVVLTDFGIAAVEDPDDGFGTRLTGSGELVGSLDYLAPERARGEDPGPACDVWALGATLYAAVEGISPFRRNSTWSTLTAIVSDPLPEPVRAGRLGPALAELLQKNPAHRADAARAAQLLAEVSAFPDPPQSQPLTDGTVHLRPPQPPVPPVSSDPRAAEQPAGSPAVPSGVPAPEHETGPQPHRTGSTTGRRRPGRTALAVAAVAVLLVGGGVTYAFFGQGEDAGGSSAGEGGPAAAGPSHAHGDRAPDGTAGSGKGDGSGAPGREGEASPAPCSGIGGGRFNCESWRTADTYDADHRRVGTLKTGVSYFYCQTKLSYRETFGEWTNVWWARTDDDSGNKGVFVSDVYLKGGDNNKPVPGLPAC